MTLFQIHRQPSSYLQVCSDLLSRWVKEGDVYGKMVGNVKYLQWDKSGLQIEKAQAL